MYVPLDLLQRPSELFYLLGQHITESTESPEQTQVLLREALMAVQWLRHHFDPLSFRFDALFFTRFHYRRHYCAGERGVFP